MCTDKNIKELLPAYAKQMLDQTHTKRVEGHLAACEDCRTEASLLRVMIADVVPDPGEAFWATMPGRVYRAVQQQKTKKRQFTVSWLADRLTIPRWVMAATMVGVVAVISLFTLRGLQREPNTPLSPEYALSDEIMAVNSSPNVAELRQDQIDAIDTWAGNALASIAQEAAPVVPVVLGSVRNSDIEEELADLNSGEIERLSRIIEQWKEEG